jgi:hypothetical protein
VGGAASAATGGLIAGDVGRVITVIVEIKLTHDANKADDESLRQENLLQHLLNLRILAEAEHTKARPSTKQDHQKGRGERNVINAAERIATPTIGPMVGPNAGLATGLERGLR